MFVVSMMLRTSVRPLTDRTRLDDGNAARGFRGIETSPLTGLTNRRGGAS